MLKKLSGMNQTKKSNSSSRLLTGTLLLWQTLVYQAGINQHNSRNMFLYFNPVSCQPAGPASLTCQVVVLDQETVLVNWTVRHDQLVLGLEIVYSPVLSRQDQPFTGFILNTFLCSYYVVLPITNPATEAAMLENLLSFTSYQLVIRTTNTSKLFIQTETLYFSTSGKKGQVNI